MKFKFLWLFVCWISSMRQHVVWSIKFPNDIEGAPTIECGQDNIYVTVNTTNGKASRIFAKGRHEDNKCSFQATNSASFSLSGCGMTRQRQLDPKGLSYDLVVVVQLHPMFVTKVDRAYNLKCFYMEADKIVTANLEVSMIRTDLVTGGSPMPQCSYSLHKDNADGNLAKYTKVGDKVWHVWECPSESYGMLVHSCYVNDGQGNNFQIIDQNGCGIDQYVIRTPEYSNELTRAQQETHVFKFADKMVVLFNCQIKLCVKEENGCSGIVPPNCGSSGNGGRETTRFPSPPTFASTTPFETSGSSPRTNDTEGLAVVSSTNSSLLNASSSSDKSTTHHYYFTTAQPGGENVSMEMTMMMNSDETANNTLEMDQLMTNATAMVSKGDEEDDNVTTAMAQPSSTTRQKIHSYGSSTKPEVDDGSGEDNEGFMTVNGTPTTTVVGKRSKKDNPSPVALMMQMDEPAAGQQRRRMPERSTVTVRDLETDVNQQMWVLEPEENQPTNKEVEEDFSTGRLNYFETSNDKSNVVCVPGWGVGFVIASFIVLLAILVLSILFVCRKSTEIRRVADLTSNRRENIFKYNS